MDADKRYITLIFVDGNAALKDGAVDPDSDLLDVLPKQPDVEASHASIGVRTLTNEARKMQREVLNIEVKRYAVIFKLREEAALAASRRLFKASRGLSMASMWGGGILPGVPWKNKRG